MKFSLCTMVLAQALIDVPGCREGTVVTLSTVDVDNDDIDLSQLREGDTWHVRATQRTDAEGNAVSGPEYAFNIDLTETQVGQELPCDVQVSFFAKNATILPHDPENPGPHNVPTFGLRTTWAFTLEQTAILDGHVCTLPSTEPV